MYIPIQVVHSIYTHLKLLELVTVVKLMNKYAYQHATCTGLQILYPDLILQCSLHMNM